MNYFRPTPWQTEVVVAPEDVNLFLGGGRGRGATTCALMLIIKAVEKYPNSHHLFVRNHLRSLSEVEDTLQFLLTGAFGSRALKINRSDHVFRLPNGSTIEFAPLADVNDIAKLQGRSFSTITADEVGNMTALQLRWLDSLRANLRGGDCPKRFVLLANPAGPAHAILVKRFVNKCAPWIATELDDGLRWMFCPANHRDNPHLPKTYQKDLFAAAGRDKELYKGWADGSWAIARGAILADVIDEVKQFIALESIGFNIHAPASYLFLSGDWGISSPSVVYLACRTLAPLGRFPRNSLLLLDEVSSADPDDLSVGLQWSPSYLADRINAMCNEHGVRNRVGVLDDARGLSDETLIGIMQQYGLYFSRPIKGRSENLALMRELLFNSKENNGRPGMWVTTRCTNWIETVPNLPRDLNRPELPDTKANDHAFDGSAYAVSHIPQILVQRQTTMI